MPVSFRYISHVTTMFTYQTLKLEFHDTDTDILARILADTSDKRDFLWQAERHADILARMSARMSVSVSASWNANFTIHAVLAVQTRTGLMSPRGARL